MKTYQFEAKSSKISTYPLCLCIKFPKILQSITWEITGLNGHVYNYNSTDISDNVNIHKYFIKKHDML